MLLEHLGVVSQTSHLGISDVSIAAAALQKQVSRDFSPSWGVEATVSSFPELEDVPIGYWPIIIRDDIDVPGAAGVHLDEDGQPFALVQYESSGWTMTLSHEILEMLADPFGNRVVAGPSPKPDQGRVEFLVEICDPSEDVDYSYTVNDLVVSDFYTPRFFDPVTSKGVTYSYTGAITEPRQVLKGGYLSWRDPATDHWWQKLFFGPQPEFRDLGVFSNAESLRSQVDARTPVPQRIKGVPQGNQMLLAAQVKQRVAKSSVNSKAQRLHQQIARLVDASKKRAKGAA